jgi:hypothetical protein
MGSTGREEIREREDSGKFKVEGEKTREEDRVRMLKREDDGEDNLRKERKK